MHYRFHPLRLLFLACVLSAPGARSDEAALEPISIERVREHVAYLSSDELAGRDSGEPGLEVAAEYLANQFRAMGLKPAGDDGSYFHHFTIPFGAAFGRGGGAVLVDQDGTETTLVSGAQAVAFGYGDSPKVDAPIVFAGYGITASEAEKKAGLDYDDYAGLDVKGKAVIVMRYLPRLKSNLAGGRFNPLASLVSKLRHAREKGAAAVIFVTPPNVEANPAPGEADLQGLAHRAAPRGSTLPAVAVKASVADDLLGRVGKDLASLVRRIDESLEPQSCEIPGMRIRFETVERRCLLRNVAAILPGTGDLAKQVVVVGGHYDHIGRFGNQVAQGSLGVIHNGADDNASGTAGVLELAKVLSRPGQSPGRSILFLCFSGEELGLFGSKAWVDAARRFRVEASTPCYTSAGGEEAGIFGAGTLLDLRGAVKKGQVAVRSVQTGATGWVDPQKLVQVSGPTALHDVVAMVNLDMVGHAKPDAPVQLYGTDTGTGLKRIAEIASERARVPVDLKGKGPGGGGSDHMSFVAKQIPSVFFFTGMHKRYNTPEDDVETLNYEGQKRVLEYARAFLVALAEAPERPAWGQAAPASTLASNPHGRMDLGIVLDADFKDGAKVSAVEPDSPPAKAGVLVGDVVLAVGEKAVRTVEDWDAAMEEAVKVEEVAIRLRRGGKEEVVKVAVPKRRGFGVSFGSVPDYGFTGSGVRFEDIRDGSPAKKAGVQPGDVLVRWGGEDVEDVEQWTAMLVTHKPGDEVAIVVERSGARVELKVKLEASRR